MRGGLCIIKTSQSTDKSHTMSEKNDGGNTKETYSVQEARLAYRDIFATLPIQFEDRYAAIELLRHVFHQEMATALAPSFIQHVRRQPQSTDKERTSLVVIMRESLERLGISLACPQTGRPGHFMVGDGSTRDTLRPKFRFVVRLRAHSKGLSTVESDELPELRLIEADATPIPSFFRWARSARSDGPTR